MRFYFLIWIQMFILLNVYWVYCACQVFYSFDFLGFYILPSGLPCLRCPSGLLSYFLILLLLSFDP